MRWWTGVVVWGGLALPGGAAPLHAQDVDELDLPAGVAREIIDFFNRPSTVRFQGRAEVPAGRTIDGDVAVLRGPMRVAGTIAGDLVVVNGDLVVEPGGRVDGDVTVLGGRADAPPGTVGGRLAIYDEALRYERRGDRIREDRRRSRFEDRRWPSRSYISVRSEDSYNRVEGLPVRFGPVIETGDANRFRLDALGVWRTVDGFDVEDLGWFVRGQQFFGLGDYFSVGGTFHSVVSPIERWTLQDVEASLATFLFHKDWRDHYEREGWSAFARFRSPWPDGTLTLEYRDEQHRFVDVGDPWTLGDNDEPWRPQPLIAEGDLRYGLVDLVVDDRNDPEDATDGWFLRATARAGLDGSLGIPGWNAPAPLPPTPLAPALEIDPAFRDGFLDVRRYARLGPDTDVRVRGVLAGSLDGDPLPPQFQHALGGEGSLPGFGLMSIDCGARDRAVSFARPLDDGVTVRTPTFPAYGCDRAALFQIEYRSSLSFGVDFGDDWDDDWDWYPAVDFSPSISLFLDAGRGWGLRETDEPGFLAPDAEAVVDAGVGLHLGDLGLYWAFPLRGGDGVNFFVRLGPRF